MSEYLDRRGHEGNGSGLTPGPEDAGCSYVVVQRGYGESLAFSGVQNRGRWKSALKNVGMDR